MVAQENATIVIDEFEDGIHHSLLTPLLRTVIELAELRHHQVFMSTHSEELIRHLLRLAKAPPNSDIAIFRLGKLGPKGAVPRFTMAEAQELLETNIDIR
jgi:AAA15 family ATPase/GTPase